MPYVKGQGGRIEGVKNKRTRLVEEIAARFNRDPFEIMMQFATRDWEGLGYEKPEDISAEVQMSAAKDACRYLYSPKPSNALEDGAQVKVIVAEFIRIKDSTPAEANPIRQID